MSEHITHVAIFEDSARVALYSDRLSPAFRTVLDKHWALAAFGSTSRSGDRHSIPVLKYCRELWATRKPEQFVEEKLAFLIGWRCHQAGDRRFKPVYRVLDPEFYARGGGEDNVAPTDVRVLHDIVIYREVYRGGKSPGRFMAGLLDDRLQSMTGARALDYDATFEMLGSVWQRSLLEFHPAQHSVAALPRRFQRFYVDAQRYAEMWANPDPDQMRRFIYEVNFYDRRDPILRLARALQHKQKPDASLSFASAYDQAAKQSQYAQAVRMGVRYLIAANDFFENKITEEECRKQFDLDKSHLKGGTL